MKLANLKYYFIRTPLEHPLRKIRYWSKFRKRRRNPELREIHLEEGRIDAAIRSILRPDSNCIDIGCHYGSMLSVFCSLAPKGRHTAFEAMPEKVEFLRKKFSDVDVRHMALSDESGTVTFYVNIDRTGFSGMAKHGKGEFRELEVPCGRLDENIDEGLHIDFIKADVEGAEYFVFRGARALLERCRPTILFECGPSGAKAFGKEPKDLYDLFVEELGYSVYFIKDWLGSKEPVTSESFQEALVYPFKAFNWIAAPRP